MRDRVARHNRAGQVAGGRDHPPQSDWRSGLAGAKIPPVSGVPAVVFEVLPAYRGDCLWIECHRAGARPWRMLFDGGTPETWPALRERVMALDIAEREIDVAVVSHIDSDHIGGMLPLLAERDLGVRFGDVWFNGLPQLPLEHEEVSRSVSEGESLMRILSGADHQPLPWNLAFDGRAAMTAGDGQIRRIEGAGVPTITLLSPTPRRLRALRKAWSAELASVRRGEPAEPALAPVPLQPLDDLATLAGTRTSLDGSIANGSSIALLIEHEGAACLLGADAWVPVLGAALTTLINQRGEERLDLEVLKLPHHGSKGNTTSKLLALAPARRYVVSTNGERFHHPDDIALARVVTSAPAGSTICFNYGTGSILRWIDADLCDRYEYRALHPPPAGPNGIRLELDAGAA